MAKRHERRGSRKPELTQPAGLTRNRLLRPLAVVALADGPASTLDVVDVGDVEDGGDVADVLRIGYPPIYRG